MPNLINELPEVDGMNVTPGKNKLTVTWNGFRYQKKFALDDSTVSRQGELVYKVVSSKDVDWNDVAADTAEYTLTEINNRPIELTDAGIAAYNDTVPADAAVSVTQVDGADVYPTVQSVVDYEPVYADVFGAPQTGAEAGDLTDFGIGGNSESVQLRVRETNGGGSNEVVHIIQSENVNADVSNINEFTITPATAGTSYTVTLNAQYRPYAHDGAASGYTEGASVAPLSYAEDMPFTEPQIIQFTAVGKQDSVVVTLNDLSNSYFEEKSILNGYDPLNYITAFITEDDSSYGNGFTINPTGSEDGVGIFTADGNVVFTLIASPNSTSHIKLQFANSTGTIHMTNAVTVDTTVASAPEHLKVDLIDYHKIQFNYADNNELRTEMANGKMVSAKVVVEGRIGNAFSDTPDMFENKSPVFTKDYSAGTTENINANAGNSFLSGQNIDYTVNLLDHSVDSNAKLLELKYYHTVVSVANGVEKIGSSAKVYIPLLPNASSGSYFQNPSFTLTRGDEEFVVESDNQPQWFEDLSAAWGSSLANMVGLPGTTNGAAGYMNTADNTTTQKFFNQSAESRGFGGAGVIVLYSVSEQNVNSSDICWNTNHSDFNNQSSMYGMRPILPNNGDDANAIHGASDGNFDAITVNPASDGTDATGVNAFSMSAGDTLKFHQKVIVDVGLTYKFESYSSKVRLVTSDMGDLKKLSDSTDGIDLSLNKNKVILSWLPIALDFAGTEVLPTSGGPVYSVKKFVTSGKTTNSSGALLDSFGDASGSSGDLDGNGDHGVYDRIWNDDSVPNASNRGTGSAEMVNTNTKTYNPMIVDGSYVTFAVKGTYTIDNSDGTQDVLSTEWSAAQCIPYLFPTGFTITSGVIADGVDAALKSGNDKFDETKFGPAGTHTAVPFANVGYGWSRSDSGGSVDTTGDLTHPYILKIKTASKVEDISQHWIIKVEKENAEDDDIPVEINTFDWERIAMLGTATVPWDRDALLDGAANPQSSNLILPVNDADVVMWGKDNEYYFQFASSEIEDNREYNVSITPVVVGVDEESHNGTVQTRKIFGEPTWFATTDWTQNRTDLLGAAETAVGASDTATLAALDPVLVAYATAKLIKDAAVAAATAAAATASAAAAAVTAAENSHGTNSSQHTTAIQTAAAEAAASTDAAAAATAAVNVFNDSAAKATFDARYGEYDTPVNTGYDYITDPSDNTKNIGLTGHIKLDFPLLDNDYVSQILFYKGSALSDQLPTASSANVFKILNPAGANADASDAEIVNDVDKKSIIDSATNNHSGNLETYSMLIKYKGDTWAPQTLTSDDQYIPHPLSPDSYGISNFTLKLPPRVDASGNAISPTNEELDISATLRNLGANSVYKHLITDAAVDAPDDAPPTGWSRVGIDGVLKTSLEDLSSNGYVIQNSSISKDDSSFSLKYQVQLVAPLASFGGSAQAPGINIEPIIYKVANYVVENPNNATVSAIHTDNVGENDLTFLKFDEPEVLYGTNDILDEQGNVTGAKDLSYTYLVEHYNEVTEISYTEVVRSIEDLAGLDRDGQYLDIQAHFNGDQQMHQFNLKTVITEQGVSDELHGTTVVNRGNKTGLTVMAPSNSMDTSNNTQRLYSEPWDVEIEDLGDVTGVLKFTVPYGQSPYLTNVAGFKLFINEQPWEGARLVEISGQDPNNSSANVYRKPSYIDDDAYGTATGVAQDGENGLSSSGGNGELGEGFIRYNSNYSRGPNNQPSQTYHVFFSKTADVNAAVDTTVHSTSDNIQNFDYLSIRTVFTNEGGNTTSKSIAAQVNSVTSPERLNNLKINDINTGSNEMTFTVDPHAADGAAGTYGSLSYVVDVYRIGGGESEFKVENGEVVMDDTYAVTDPLFGSDKWTKYATDYVKRSSSVFGGGTQPTHPEDLNFGGQNGGYFEDLDVTGVQAIIDMTGNDDKQDLLMSKFYAAMKLETVLTTTRPVVATASSSDNTITVPITGLSPSYIYIATVYAVGAATTNPKYSLPVVFDIQNTDNISSIVTNEVGSIPPKLNMKFTLPYDSGLTQMKLTNKVTQHSITGIELGENTLVLSGDADNVGGGTTQSLTSPSTTDDNFYVNKWPTTNQFCFSISVPSGTNYESSFNEPVEFDISLVPNVENERPVVELANQSALFRKKPQASDLLVTLANADQSDLSNNQIRIRSNGNNGHHEKFKDLLVLIEWENEDEDGMIVKQYANGTHGDSAEFSGHWNAEMGTHHSIDKVITIPTSTIGNKGVITGVYVYGSNEFGMSGASGAASVTNEYVHTYA